MADYIDVSVRVLDPDDDYRLFELPEDAAAATILLEAAMPQAGGACVIAPPLYYGLADGARSVRAVNDFVWAYEHPSVAAVFGVVEPKHQAEAHAELERLAARGARGVVWSPRAQGVFANDGLMIGLCRRAHELGLVSMTHAAPYSTNEGMWRLWRLAATCPEVTFLVSGALMSWEWVQAVLEQRGGEPNIAYDTAGMMEGAPLKPLVAALGAERLLYGGGGRDRMGRLAATFREGLAASGLSIEHQQDVLWRNATRLLKIDTGAGSR